MNDKKVLTSAALDDIASSIMIKVEAPILERGIFMYDAGEAKLYSAIRDFVRECYKQNGYITEEE